MKSDIADGRVRLNLAAFFYDYSDLQVSTFDATTGTTRIENAASAEVLGAEADLSVNFLDNLVWNLGVSWLDTEYQGFVTTNGSNPNPAPPPATLPIVVDLSGNNLTNAPDLKFVTNLRWDLDLFYLFAQYSWQDDVFHSQFNEAVIGQDSYGLLDLRAGFSFGQDDAWEVAAIVKNATDEEYYQNSVRFTSLSNGTTDPTQVGAALGYPGEGRSYGAQIRYSF